MMEDINVLNAGLGWANGPMFGGVCATSDYEGNYPFSSIFGTLVFFDKYDDLIFNKIYYHFFIEILVRPSVSFHQKM